MKIKNLKIIKIHNLYDYDVEFNPDLTFLFGTNGCGKTTILNIIESIVSGHIYNLFSWTFEKIILEYYDDELENIEYNTIAIYYKGDGLNVEFDGKTWSIRKDYFQRYAEDADSVEELFDLMVSKYTFLYKLKDKFNYVYLPLDRNSANNSEAFIQNRYLSKARRRVIYVDDEEYPFTRDEEILKAAKMVQQRYVEANARATAINDEFRNKLLKSLLGTNENVSNDNYVGFIVNSINEGEVNSLKEQYMRLLDTLDILDRDEEYKYVSFFKSYEDQVNRLREAQYDKKAISVSLSLIFNYHEIQKIKTVIPLAQEAEEKKANEFKRIYLFIDTINSFIHHKDDDKIMYIDSTGNVKFKTNYGDDNISVRYLSSGEKQLFIFFANLVFNVNDSSSGIFVVDEPELSLHLSWQKSFVRKAQEVNGNMQLIFATHAPEIVGANREKMVRLEKKIHK